jgi:membrane protein insertase Oxa1/YidC/SpoIIIJ
MSAQLVQLLAFMKVGEAISIIFSALLVRLLLNGLSAGGTISKLVRPT